MTMSASSRRPAVLGVLAWMVAYAALWWALGGFAGSAVTLALTGANHATTTKAAAAGSQPRVHAPTIVKSAAPRGVFLDPTNHAFPAAQIPDAVSDPAHSGSFRDPTTHELLPVRRIRRTGQPARASAPPQAPVLRSLTPAERRYVLGILALTPTQLRAAFGTGK